jgi:hypothetical protein
VKGLGGGAPGTHELHEGDPMPIQSRPELQALQVISPLVVAVVFILGCSLIKEPGRRHFNALMIAGAGAAYLNGGLGVWEFAFTPIVTFCAYKGLDDFRFIGVGWVLHTIWDVIHHLYGTPIVPFVPTSSAGCAICDLGIALWCFAGAPSAYEWFGKARAAAGRGDG